MDLVEFSYPVVNLGIYKRNFSGKCMVSCYEHDKDTARVYIVDLDQPFDFNLSDEMVKPMKDFPSFGEVFAVDLEEDGLHRVVCNAGNKSLFFIDCGEVMEVDGAKLQMYSLSDEAQRASARAIPCAIVEMLDEHGNQINDIAELLYEQVCFNVIQIESDKLVVALYKTNPMDSVVCNNQDRGVMELTQEQLDILNEEPEMMTTNAMRAVLGYNPQDEKRNCPYYDPEIGGCFKGNRCQLEHVAPIQDGWTRDRKESMINLGTDTVPIIGSTVKVCVTCIVSADEFYVHIPEISARYNGSLEDLKSEMNTVEMVYQYQPFIGMPNLLDLVLVKRENFIYRGKVVETDEQHFAIQFLDYGYTELMPRNTIYQWHPRWNIVPAQAHRCYLENVRLRKVNDEDARMAFRNLILSTADISAKIIGYTGDLFVRLYDADGVDIGETLCAYGLVQLKPKIVPDSTQIPG